MKKALAIFVTVCLLASLFVSCDNTTKLDELVSTRFDAAGSRSLIVSNENFIDFNDSTIKWQYKARKVSDPSYNVGAAAEWTLIPANGYAIGDLRNSIEFSQGKWDFELRAVKVDANGNIILDENNKPACVVYYGKTETNNPVLLTKQDIVRTISINLTAQLADQKGFIVLSGIGIKHKEGDTLTFDVPNEIKIDDSPLDLDDTAKITTSGNTISTVTGIEVGVGTHTITVKKKGINDEILAEDSKTFEVYAGLTTTISNWIVEITQAGKFVVFTDTASTGISAPSEGSSVNVVFRGITPSMVNYNNTTVTLPSSTLEGVESAKLSVAVKQASEASVDGAFNATDSEKVIAAVIDLSLSSSSGLIENFGDNTVIVSTYVAKNLSDFKFGYPGENDWNSVDIEAEVNAAKKYWYDSLSGKLVFGTNHFSSFIVETSSVAVIGDTAYQTLADAFDYVQNDETIVLVKNITTNYGYLYNRNITSTLDLNSCTLRVTGSDSRIDGGRAIKVTAGTLTIKNGTIDGRSYTVDGVPNDNPSSSSPWSSTRTGGCVRVSGGNVVLDGLTLYNNDGWGNAVKMESNNHLIINNCTINSVFGAGLEAGIGITDIYDSVFNQTGLAVNDYVSTCIAAAGLGTVNIYNTITQTDGYSSLYIYNSGGVINVYGGSFSSNDVVIHVDEATKDNFTSNYGDANPENYESFVAEHNGKSSLINIEAGQFVGSISVNPIDSSSAGVSITGGTFSTNPSDYVASGHTATPNEDGSIWTVALSTN